MKKTENPIDSTFTIDGITIRFTEIFTNDGSNVADIIENNIIREVKHNVAQ